MNKIAVITGSRAEYGLLYWLMKELDSDKNIDFQLIVTGSHLSKDMGQTIDFIQEDGFEVTYQVDMQLESDKPIGITSSMSKAIEGFGEAYNKIKPDLILLLGDRYEIFIAAAAATIFRIPIGHLHGGERTEGAFDEVFRHSLSKMSQLHFTAHNEYSNRVIQMGEQPENVYNVGALAIDNIKKLPLFSRKEVEERINLAFSGRNIIVTFHPTTLEKESSYDQFSNLLKNIDKLKNTSIIFTKSNADVDARVIDNLIDEYVEKNSDKARAFSSMGQKLYLSTLQYVDATVGNSSSGIIEAPLFKIGTINIGDRQKGRFQVPSIINCLPNQNSISEAFEKLYSDEFQATLKRTKSPYGEGGAAKKIKEIVLEKLSNGDITLKKEFFDIKF